MQPDPGGFLVRYILAFAPLVVLVISLATSAALSGFVEGFNASLPGQVRTVMAGIDEFLEMGVLLTAPVGIYLTFVFIGWKVKVTEIWTGSALALGLSGLAGLLIVTFSPDPTLSHLLDLLYWVAYLIAPASVAAALVLVARAEKFRRSISYTFTVEGVLTRGGIWRRHESLLPYHQIGKVVMEQGPVGHFLHIGTIIPVGMASGGPAAGLGRGKEAFRHPLDCLYGISHPEKARELLEQLVSLQSVTEEEQPPETGESPGSR
jgi:membrane protein YdbS with pleckstrin-like domain